MATSKTLPDRLAELLADEAAGSPDREGHIELQQLLADNAGLDRDQMMTAASLAQVAFLQADRPAHIALPEALRERLMQQATTWNAGQQSGNAAPVADLDRARRRRQDELKAAEKLRDSRAPRRSAAGWYVAAALALVIIVLRLAPEPSTAPVVVTTEEQRAALVKLAPDLVTAPWGASAEPGYEKAQGDVVWSDARQEGYLRITGLPVNDRARAQYQLWVVDASRDVHPVDGGVFDITTDGELIIPIQAKLAVSRPAAFAVTLEQPGGVVVSDGPMLLVAPVVGT